MTWCACAPGPSPTSLRNLARIQDFSLYITTTVDHLMFQAMNEARQGTKVEQIKFTPRGSRARSTCPTTFITTGPPAFITFSEPPAPRMELSPRQKTT
jgi:hypothetical protein